MRIAIAGILHESNSFSRETTELRHFEIARGADMVRRWADAGHELGGFLEGAKLYGFEAAPLLSATAIPGGPVSSDAFESLRKLLLEQLQMAGSVDGMLLALHGAMYSHTWPDADGELVTRVRRAVGPDFPLVVTHDFHANVSDRLAAGSTALVVYKTCPHVDQRERGLQAASILARTIRDGVRPTMVLARPPMIYPIMGHNTSSRPLAPVFERVREIEREPGVLAANVAAGYQYADVWEAGVSVTVVTDNDPALAEHFAGELSALLWDTRSQLNTRQPEAAEAVRQAMESEATPVVLVDIGDNVGGGSPADSTILLSELLTQKAQGWTTVIYSPAGVQTAAAAGVSHPVSMKVGTPAVAIQGRVRGLHEGTFVEPEVRHGGARYNDQGVSALVEVGGPDPESPNLLLLTSKRMPPFSLQQLISAGVAPHRQKILVVKAAVAFRAAYEPVARRIIEVNTPGITAADPRLFTYQHLRRPVFPLDL